MIQASPQALDDGPGSPLVGRADLVALAERRAYDVAAGRGHVLFLAGEAGIGKTRLLGVIEGVCRERGFEVIRGSAFPGDIDLAGALFEDVARGDRRSGRPRPAIATIEARLRDGVGQGDAHRHRRLLVVDLAELVLALPADRPVLLALEDLHWADDLALEVLAHVARAIRERPLLMVGTYRSDELYPRTPMREWRSRLVTSRQAEEARLGRLSRDQTVGLVAALVPGETLPTSLLDAIHDRSDGIPLHVEELVGAIRQGHSGVAAGAHGAAVPGSLAEAVLARLGPLDADVGLVVSTAAVIGRSFDLDLLAACVEMPMAALGPPIAWLQQRFVIVPTPDGRGYDFRHALIRDALYEQVPLPTRRVIHGRVADVIAALRGPTDDGVLSAHYDRAGRSDEASLHAARAGRRAAAISAHREAHALFRRALDNLAPGTHATDRAGLLVELADAAAATDHNEEAAHAYAEARAVLLATGQPEAAADLVPRLVAVRHLLGDDLASRVALIETGLDELRSAEPAATAVRGRLVAANAAAHMLDRRLGESIRLGEAARDLAASAGDVVTELNVSATLGSCLVFAGRMDEGWATLARTIDRARATGHEAEAARAYRMAGTSASVLVEYPRADAWLRDGIEHAERVELWNHRHYMASHLAHVAWATGDWDAAGSIAEHALADGRGGLTTRITAAYVQGYVALGRGDWLTAERLLAEAHTLGAGMRELQRLSPPLWGLAEMAVLQGDHARAVELSEAGRRASVDVDDAAYLFPFLVTGTRARLGAGDPGAAQRWVDEVGGALERPAIPGTLPAVPHARGLLLLASGQTRRARHALGEAAAGWVALGRVWEGAWASLDLARCASRTNRAADAARHAGEVQATAQRLGSRPLADAAGAFLARRRGADAAPWAPLTAREFEVARLVGAGWTDHEIAHELGLSSRTVGSHVTHILDKLGVARRTGIAAWVATVGAPPATAP